MEVICLLLSAVCLISLGQAARIDSNSRSNCTPNFGACLALAIHTPPCNYGAVKLCIASLKLNVSISECDQKQNSSANINWDLYTASGWSSVQICRNRLSCEIVLPSTFIASLVPRKCFKFIFQVFSPNQTELEGVFMLLVIEGQSVVKGSIMSGHDRKRRIAGHIFQENERPEDGKGIHRNVIVKRQGSDYDENLTDLESLVAEEEANSADVQSMAGQRGAGWTQWSPWSTCSVSCGTVGEKTRQRQCQNDPLSGVGCDGADKDTDTCKPSVLKCPETDSWLAWSEWGECSRTCGDGLKTRERSCVVSNPSLSCPGDSAQTQPCNLQSCDLKESWTKWSEWSRCSVTCGEGHKSRERVCKDDKTGVETSNCPGSKHNSEVCDQPMCSSGVQVKTVHAIEGHSATLKCLYDRMLPPVVIYWLTPDGKRINHQSHDRSYEAIGDSLFIRHSTSNMVGLFRCVVHDSKGKVLMGEAPVDVLDCSSRPCMNGGVCQEIQAVDHFSARYTTFRCLCGTGFNGARCEGGLGPGGIAALFLCVVLAGIAIAAFCMVRKFREEEKTPKKLIGTRGSKLIVVTSRDALAVSCGESSSDASVADEPVRQFDLESDVRADPKLKTSKGIGAIFPKWGRNNNNSFQRTFSSSGSFNLNQQNKNNHRYAAVNTSEVAPSDGSLHKHLPLNIPAASRSSSETTIFTQRSRRDGDENRNHCEGSDSSRDTSASSDTGVGETASDTSSSPTASSSTSVTNSSSGSDDKYRKQDAKQRNQIFKNIKTTCKSSPQSVASTTSRSSASRSNGTGSTGTSSEPSLTTRTDLTSTNHSTESTWRPSTTSSLSNQASFSSHWPNNASASCQHTLTETPKRKQASKNLDWNNGLFGEAVNTTTGAYAGLRRQGFTGMSFTAPSSQVGGNLDDRSLLTCTQPLMLNNGHSSFHPASPLLPGNGQNLPGGTQGLSQNAYGTNINHSCRLLSDSAATPMVDPLRGAPVEQQDCRLDLPSEECTEMLHGPEFIFEPNFSSMFNRLRARLNKERERACAKMRSLTSIVSEPSGDQVVNNQQSDKPSSNIPAYGNPRSHATSTPTDESSVNGRLPKIHLSAVSPSQTSADGGQSYSTDSPFPGNTPLYSPEGALAIDTDPLHAKLFSPNRLTSHTLDIASHRQAPYDGTEDWEDFDDVKETAPLLTFHD